MSDRERCTGCGAKVPAETGVCAYCGTTASADANVPPPARDRASEKIERFDRLAEHPSFDKWMRWRPLVARPRPDSWRVGGAVLLSVGLLVFLVAALGDRKSHFPGIVVGLAMTVFGLRIWRALPERMSSSTAPAKPYPALVVTKRTEVTAEQHARTRYFVTLEFRSGTRREYDVDGAFFGLVADDDLGVAYIREGELLNFKKLDA